MAIADVEELISEIYEAAVIPEQWPGVLARMSDFAGGAGGILFVANLERAKWVASPDIHDLFEEFVRDGWAAINRRPARLAEANHAGFLRDLDVFTAEELDADKVYTQFYRKRGVGWATGTLINVPSGDSIVISVERAFEKGPIETSVVRAFDRLRPHLARGALLSSRLDLARAEAMTAALEQLGLPAAVLRRSGRVLAANSKLEGLIPSVFQDRSDRLHIDFEGADSLLAISLDAIGQGQPAKSVSSIPVAAGEGRPPLIAHLIPIQGAALDIFSEAHSLLIVTEVNPSAVPTAKVLEGLFDLSPAEARVARAVGNAQSVDAIAQAMNVSRETIRTQLKSVLTKTGLRRQTELINLIAGKIFPLTPGS